MSIKKIDVKKWIPWNWFKKEEEGAANQVLVHRKAGPENTVGNPIEQFHREIDRMFDQFWRGRPPYGGDLSLLPGMMGGMLKPTLDLGVTDQKYTVELEIPGVNASDVKLEIANDTMTIRGEKKQENEEQGKNYYRMERSYGAFQRVLSLPEDADQDNIEASFAKGVLTIALPRKALPHKDVRQIKVKSAG